MFSPGAPASAPNHVRRVSGRLVRPRCPNRSLSPKMIGPSRAITRSVPRFISHRDVPAVRDVDDAREAGRERNRAKKLQLHTAKKLQPE